MWFACPAHDTTQTNTSRLTKIQSINHHGHGSLPNGHNKNNDNTGKYSNMVELFFFTCTASSVVFKYTMYRFPCNVG
uniref:Uncharacterized protein n=1 Tax=Arundo donax TaxID=35708 RepID=A0A0A9DCB6_ARUDO